MGSRYFFLPAPSDRRKVCRLDLGSVQQSRFATDMATSRETPRIRLAELVATLSLASDIALGKPYEHAQRGAIGAVRLGEASASAKRT